MSENAVEVLRDMLRYRKNGINEFLELHRTGGNTILEIETKTLSEALLALEKQDNNQKDARIEELELVKKIMFGEPHTNIYEDWNLTLKHIEMRLTLLKKKEVREGLK